MSFNNRKHNLEFRIKYNEKGMLVGWKITAKKEEVWTDPYICVPEWFMPKPGHRVIDNKLVEIDTSIHVYHKPVKGILANNNPYFCKGEINESN